MLRRSSRHSFPAAWTYSKLFSLSGHFILQTLAYMIRCVFLKINGDCNSAPASLSHSLAITEHSHPERTVAHDRELLKGRRSAVQAVGWQLFVLSYVMRSNIDDSRTDLSLGRLRSNNSLP